jgi:hypothetical protein
MSFAGSETTCLQQASEAISCCPARQNGLIVYSNIDIFELIIKFNQINLT